MGERCPFKDCALIVELHNNSKELLGSGVKYIAKPVPGAALSQHVKGVY